MNCPQCGREFDAAEECPFCGIVIAKAGARSPRAAPRLERTTESRSSRLRTMVIISSVLTAIACAIQITSSSVICICGRCGSIYSPGAVAAIGACVVLFFAPLLSPHAGVWSGVGSLLASAVLWVLFYGPGMWGYAVAILDGSDYFDIVLVLPALLLGTVTVLSIALINRERERGFTVRAA